MTKTNLLFLTIGFLIGFITAFPAALYLLRRILLVVTESVAAELVAEAFNPALAEMKLLAAKAHFGFAEAGAAISAAAQTFADLADSKADPAEKDDQPSPILLEVGSSDAPDDQDKKGLFFLPQAEGATLKDFTEIETVAEFRTERNTASLLVARAFLCNVEAGKADAKTERRFACFPFDYCRGLIVYERNSAEVPFLYLPPKDCPPLDDQLAELESYLKRETFSDGFISKQVSPNIYGEVIAKAEFPSMRFDLFSHVRPIAFFDVGERLIIAAASFDNTRTVGFRFGGDYPNIVHCYIVYDENRDLRFSFIPFDEIVAEDQLAEAVAGFLRSELKVSGVLTAFKSIESKFDRIVQADAFGFEMSDFSPVADYAFLQLSFAGNLKKQLILSKGFHIKRDVPVGGFLKDCFIVRDAAFPQRVLLLLKPSVGSGADGEAVVCEYLRITFGCSCPLDKCGEAYTTDAFEIEKAVAAVNSLPAPKPPAGTCRDCKGIAPLFWDGIAEGRTVCAPCFEKTKLNADLLKIEAASISQAAALDEHNEKYFSAIYTFDKTDIPSASEFSELIPQAEVIFDETKFTIFAANYEGTSLDESGTVALVLDKAEEPVYMLKPATTQFLFSPVVEFLNLSVGSRGKLKTLPSAFEPIKEGGK